MRKIKLSSQNRQFFQLVADAAYTNPFGTERTELDQKIAGVVGVTDRKKRVDKVIEAINERLCQLDADKRLRFQDFEGNDAQLMRYTYLFEVYHQYAQAFDDFTVAQQTRGENP